ncbi:unnamed protein product [Medioppia subpectinata]|uniref:Uncharacterized protein n=1 Tax=Medioppia subpectinata TaxID=1979941 RepID=A0A7R9Q4S5_9ACAR|nr:unnamed protein product [Medioppia subpectinata]CAG2112980.1 unnamed protein product [Medioppia subpectinata]
MSEWESNDCHTCSDNKTISGEDFDPTDHSFLCHPELMSKQELKDLLRNRRVCLPQELTTNGYEYCNLIDLYKRVLLPLPQRKYGDSRHDIQLKAKQLDCNMNSALKRKSEELHANQDSKKAKTITINNNNSNYEINSKRMATQVSQQTYDNKRQRVNWP